jgi:CBS domain containing-hemolysin-like protein
VAAVVAVLILVLAAVIRAGTASLVRTPRADALRAAAEGVPGAEVVARLLEDRTTLQASLGTSVTLLIVLAVIPLTWALTDSLSGVALALALAMMAIALVVLVDVIPRWIGRTRSGGLAYRLGTVLRFAYGAGAIASDLIVDSDELVLDDNADLSDEDERQLIRSVLEFTDTIVREVMVPRTDMITIGADDSTDDAVDLVLSSGRSRIPVTGDSIDHIVGVIYARDLLELFDSESPARSVRGIAREAYFVPETKAVAELLREMQKNQLHLAIVEEIVGEIVDEYDEEEPMVVEVDGGWIVDARLDVDELAELTEIELPAEEWDTVGGLLLDLAGRVPEEGERFEHDGLALTATSVQGRRVSKVRVAKL